MPSLNTPVQRLKVAILPLDLPCSGPVTHSGEILTTGKSHMPRNKLPRVMKRYSRNGRRNHGRSLKILLDTWDRNVSTSGPTPWQIYDDDDDNQFKSILTVYKHTHIRKPVIFFLVLQISRHLLFINLYSNFSSFVKRTTRIFLREFYLNYNSFT